MAKSIINLGCPPQKIRVHHLGIQLENFPYRPRSLQIGEALRVLIAASFIEKKGIPDALEALGNFQYKFPIEITLIGDSSNKPRARRFQSYREKQEIFRIIKKYSLMSKIKIMGFQPYNVLISEMYRNHVFLSPSITASDGDTEGGAPVSIIEAAATGMPVISTTHCDIPEVLVNTPQLIVPEHDVLGIIQCLEWLVSNSQSWEPILREGRSHIESEYDAKIQGKKLANIYSSIIK